jgi:diguanylate cyclase (GGDEF)-like protein
MNDALHEEGLAIAVMDALAFSICVVDPAGVITAVNRAWMEFSAGNGGDTEAAYVGVNYLEVCRAAVGEDSDEAPDFYTGLKAVLDHKIGHFQLEYPCHSPAELRWYIATVSPLRPGRGSGRARRLGAVVSHLEITDRKLLELDYRKLASTDPLTGLPNRRFFDEYAALEFHRFVRFGEPVSFLMLDLDGFKAINDRYGHAAGDEVLRQVAELFRSATRSADLFARYGGEEFVALLPETDEANALSVAEKLRAAVEGMRIKAGSRRIPVTISIGVAAMRPGDASLDAVTARADEALYRAKREGRNCVRAARPLRKRQTQQPAE